MTVKKVMLAVMCVLLVTVIVMMGIVVGRVNALLQSVLGTNTPTGTTTAPAGSSSATTQPTVPPTTQPTVPPTTQPTVPPTTLPTEPPHVHEYVLSETSEPTCEIMGYSIYICTGCEKQDIQDFVDAYGHNYGAGQVIEPTCEEGGCTRYTCSRCGEVDERNRKDPLGHDFVMSEAVIADCVTSGYEKYQCSHCGVEELRNETEAPGHLFELIGMEIQPSCTETGFRLEQCGVCGQENVVITPAHGHEFSEWAPGPEGGVERSCIYCDLLETAQELTITSTESFEAEDGSTVYTIYVGTGSQPDIFCYTVYDFRESGPLAFALDPVLGLVVTYTDGIGDTVQIVRSFLDPTPIEIPAG